MKCRRELIATVLLITGMASGCGQKDMTRTVNGYTVSGPADAKFMPTKITDDGKATTIQLQAPFDGEPPAFFVMDQPPGKSMARYHWKPATSQLVLEGRFRHAVLVMGKKRVRITRE
jgi:hypothetical protein